MNRSDLMEALLSGAAMRKGDDLSKNKPATAAEIKELGERYLEKHEFKVGQLIKAKKGLNSYMCASNGEPVVIIEIANGMRSDAENGGNHGYEPNDIRIGFINHEGDFDGVWVDSNRFEPWE